MFMSHHDKLMQAERGCGGIHLAITHLQTWRYSYNSLASLSLEGGGWSAICPTSFTHGKDLVPVLQEARWVSGLVCMSTIDYRG